MVGPLAFVLGGCMPFPPLWGPKGAEEFLEEFSLLLLLGLGGALALFLWKRYPQRSPGLAARLAALRERAGGLPPERAQRVLALVLEAWEAWGQGDQERARTLAARAEALMDLYRDAP
ncbi:hypothetical protein [Thermus islandicus]|uniref:hypothetical protein n=1 Tax=Thermus islandicus TaxID=540988 RepID=UPI0012EB74BE|nr:hypothetical protein [Thermus islandicus]